MEAESALRCRVLPSIRSPIWRSVDRYLPDREPRTQRCVRSAFPEVGHQVVPRAGDRLDRTGNRSAWGFLPIRVRRVRDKFRLAMSSRLPGSGVSTHRKCSLRASETTTGRDGQEMPTPRIATLMTGRVESDSSMGFRDAHKLEGPLRRTVP